MAESASGTDWRSTISRKGMVSRRGCMIAAVALRSGVPLATANRADFRPFEGEGLTLLP